MATSGLYSVEMQGQLENDVRRLHRLVKDAEGNVTRLTADGDNATLLSTWQGISTQLKAEYDAAAGQLASRFSITLVLSP